MCDLDVSSRLKLWFFSAHVCFLSQLNTRCDGRRGICAARLHGKEKVETLSLCMACGALLPWFWSFDTSSHMMDKQFN